MLQRVLCSATLLLVATAASAARPVTFDDIMQMARLDAAAISPDGQWVLYAVRRWETSPQDRDKKVQRSQIWRAGTADGQKRQLTFDAAGASSPSWSPDGRHIAFLSSRGQDDNDVPQLWIMRADGGEAWPLTSGKEAIASYAWSPDSRRIAFTAREAVPADVEARRKRGDDRRIYEDEFRHAQLWAVEVSTKAVVRLTDGATLHVKGQPSWSPDSTRVVFAAAPTPMTRDDRDDLYILAVADRKAEKVTTNAGSDAAPKWSPDGATVAFVTAPSSEKPGPDGLGVQNPRQPRLALLDVATRTVTEAADPSTDVSPGPLTWTPDGRRLLFPSGTGAYVDVFAYERGATRYARLTSGRVVSLLTLSRDGSKAAFVAESATMPADVHVSDAGFGSARRVSQVNPQVEGLSLGTSEVLRWKSDGLEIEGVLLKPVGFQAGKRYPLLVVVHGGPAGAHLDNFKVAYGDGGQHWAGQGWAVLYPNPRGSTNYGERFMRANIPDWGGGDYRDIMAGVDAAIAAGVADPERLAIQGWSYGGYMTSWAVTQTNRFKAAMVGAGITNLWSMYGTNDLPNYLAAFFRGTPSSETLPLYIERSAVAHAHKATTPTLILHGGSDERVPIGQPMEFYRALKDKGTPVQLVFYPRQGHGLQEYHHQLDRLQRQFEWITTYTLGDASRKTTTTQ